MKEMRKPHRNVTKLIILHNVGAVNDRPRATDGRPYKRIVVHIDNCVSLS